ncbi:MAG: hypothetical protein IKC97_02535 [Clostridia bacterium]|nr:hypothetical protein [Clostridia bacterium]
MKNFRSFLRALLCLLLSALLLFSGVACKPQIPDEPDPEPQPEEELIELIQDGKMTYTVVRPDGASTEIRTTAVRLCAAIKEKTGLKEVPISDDYVNRNDPVPTDTLEILVGRTNRAESVDAHAQLGENQYIISFTNNRVVIIGYDDAATAEAVTYFINNILEKGGKEGSLTISANLSLKNTYEPPIVNPFGPELPMYPDQNKPTTTPLEYVKPTYSIKDGMYVQEYKGLEIDGVMTTFQTSTMYSELYGIHSDSVMVYSTNYKNFADWYKPGTYVVDMMIAINRATKTYVETLKRQDDIQTNSAGEYLEHPAGGSYYMVPTERWIEYVWEEMLEPVIIACHPQTIALEEPEMWASAGYSESFKQEWEDYYGEEWEDPASSAENMLKANLLKTYLFERIIIELSARIKELSPTTQVYIATHSTVNYSDWAIDAGLNHYVATGALDGVIGQTWSDTHNTAFPYRASNFTDNFTNAFIEYSSYVDSVEGLNFYALADPMMDNESATEADCQYFYRQSIAASLLQPEINRFQILPWVNRAFANVSNNYRTIQSQIFEALNNIGGKPITIEAGTPGITYLISDSLSWMNTGKNWAFNTTDGLYGILAPLVRDGIPTKMKSMDQIESAADLEGVTVLIVSFDSNVPLDEKINIAIADWVKAGGTLLFISGSNQYWDVDDYFFWKDDVTPLNNLLKHLGLEDIETTTVSGDNLFSCSEYLIDDYFDGQKLAASYRKFTIAFEGASNPILEVGDSVIGIDESVGDGSFIAIGLPSAFFSGNRFGPEMIRSLTEYALQYTDYDYCGSDLMTVRRGNIVAAHAYNTDQELEGLYINLYSGELTVLEDPIIRKNDSIVMCDITDVDLSVPRLGYTAGHIQDGSLSETAKQMTYTITSAGNTIISNRILLPDDVYPQSIDVFNTKTSMDVSILKYTYDEDSHSVLIMFDGNVDPLEVTINFGNDKNAVSSQNTQFAEHSILTNEENQDKDYLIHNTAGVNSGVRYCDNDGVLIYKFDLTEYENASYYFNIAQNYIFEISPDGEDWTIIADYSEGGKVDRITNADNATVVAVYPNQIDELDDELYVRLRNTSFTGGHGGSISRITIRYTIDGKDAPEVDQAPGKNNTSTEIVPSKDGSSATDESKYLVSTKNGISTYKRTVMTNSDGEDNEFIEFNSAGANNGLRYCDHASELIYAYDVKDMLTANFTFYVSQNYILEASSDGTNFEIVADYSQGGKIPHLITGGNEKAIKINLLSYGSTTVYVRLRNSDPNQGWGGSISKFVMEYTKEAK